MNERVLRLAKRAIMEDIFPNSVFVPAAGLDPQNPMDCAVYFRKYILAQPVEPIEGEKLAGLLRYANAIPMDHSEREQTENILVEMPTDLYSKIGFAHITEFFRKHSDYIPDSPVCFLDWDHYCANFPYVLKHGLKGYLDRIAFSLEAHKKSSKDVAFLKAMEYVVLSMKLYFEHLANEYEKRGRGDLAAISRKVPWNRPESFREAVQAYWSTWLFLPDSLARMDQYLQPFYEKDVSIGKITPEEAEELIGEMYVKCFAWRPGGGFTEHRSADVTFSAGGYNAYGEDGFNEMSLICIKALAALPTWRPQCNVRVNKKTPFEVFKLIAKYNKVQCNIVYTNDDARIPAFINMGIPYDDAVEYTMVGCNEWTMVGKGHTGSQGFFNPMKAMERSLEGFATSLDAIPSFDEYYTKFELCLKEDVFKMMDLADAYYDACTKDISVVTSIFVEDCIDKAKSLTCSGQRYSTSNWACTGLADIIDIQEPLTQKYIQNLHYMLMIGTVDERKERVTPGEYRTDRIKPRNRRLLPAKKINSSLGELLREYEARKRVDRSIILDFHVRFEQIFPFEDGNGRVGRLIMFKECLRYDVMPFILDDKSRTQYLAGIQDWSSDRWTLTEVVQDAQDRFEAQVELQKLAARRGIMMLDTYEEDDV